MYAFIKGRLAELNPAYAIIEANGVGYMLSISVNTYSLIGKHESCMLHTHLVVREDAQVLYGFAEEEERRLFRLLISVSGVGPTTAMLILSSMNSEELTQTIISGDVAMLKAVKGIGAKSAQRIIIDLKDKLDKGEVSMEKLGILHNTKKEEALTGLQVLGFNKKVVEKVLDKLLKEAADQGDSITVEELIKRALKIL